MEVPEFPSPGHWGRGGDKVTYENKHLIYDIDDNEVDYDKPVDRFNPPPDHEPKPDPFYDLARLNFFETTKNNELITGENTGKLKYLRQQHEDNKKIK